MTNKSFPNYILTGATGVLGSHILYELFQSIHDNGYKGRIIILLRSKGDKSAEERFLELFHEDLAPDFIYQLDLARLIKDHIQVIDFDLKDAASIKQFMGKAEKKYQLIHCAASVNLGNSSAAFDEIKHTNYLGTLSLIQFLLPYIHKVSYISTAFAFRPKEAKGLIDYRNPYEKFKAQTEEEVAQICDGYGLEWQILRPSIVCGRLVDYPKYTISRFLVFYLFGAFFYRAKSMYNDMPIRIALNKNSGLNMVPVDYAAKAIFRALPTKIQELNIVHSEYVPNTIAVPRMLEEAGWFNYTFVDAVPTDLNPAERLYYRTAGSQLSQYLMAPDYAFDTNVLHDLMYDIEEPNIEEEFPALCQYAVDREFVHVMA